MDKDAIARQMNCSLEPTRHQKFGFSVAFVLWTLAFATILSFIMIVVVTAPRGYFQW